MISRRVSLYTHKHSRLIVWPLSMAYVKRVFYSLPSIYLIAIIAFSFIIAQPDNLLLR